VDKIIARKRWFFLFSLLLTITGLALLQPLRSPVEMLG
jgi:hypothetical protein